MTEIEPWGPTHDGIAAASYFGGRSEVKVRRIEVPVWVVDATSMYPFVFILQNLQALLASKALYARDATTETLELLDSLDDDALFKPGTWPLLNRFVLIRPDGDILPVRQRLEGTTDPFTIAVAPFTSGHAYWYTFADVLAARLLGKKKPVILKAIEVLGRGKRNLHPVPFRGTTPLDPGDQIFRTIVDERQAASREAKNRKHSEVGRLERGLKLLANSGAYGIYAEVNVTPSDPKLPKSGHVYSDVNFPSDNVHDERPGSFANFPIASLVTGGARLLLAMLEAEVAKAGGSFAFCDTDSLAIVAGKNSPEEIACLRPSQVRKIIARFNTLNPYESARDLIKIEQEGVLCYAVAPKRYVLYRRSENGRIQIVKASESALGTIIGRSPKETTKKLARRVWLHILAQEVGMDSRQRTQVKGLCNFDIPLRRKLPLGQPVTWGRFRRYNRRHPYREQVKPFGFVQALTVALEGVNEDVRPIAPFEKDATISRTLPWVDASTGKALEIDWHGNYYAGTIPVMRLDEYVSQYARKTDSKSADAHGNPTTEESRGLLHRLPIEADEPIHIGKEADRLDEDEGTSLGDHQPVIFREKASRTRGTQELDVAIKYLGAFPQGYISKALGISERRWRDILKHRARPHRKRQRAIIRLAREIGAT